MTGGASLTSESELCRGLDLPVAPGDEALVDAVVLPLEVVDLQGLLVETDPVVVGDLGQILIQLMIRLHHFLVMAIHW